MSCQSMARWNEDQQVFLMIFMCTIAVPLSFFHYFGFVSESFLYKLFLKKWVKLPLEIASAGWHTSNQNSLSLGLDLTFPWKFSRSRVIPSLFFTWIANNQKSYHYCMFRGVEDSRKMCAEGHIATAFPTFKHFLSWPLYYLKIIAWQSLLLAAGHFATQGQSPQRGSFQARFVIDPGRGTGHFLPESNSKGIFNLLVSTIVFRKDFSCYSPKICVGVKFVVQLKIFLKC